MLGLQAGPSHVFTNGVTSQGQAMPDWAGLGLRNPALVIDILSGCAIIGNISSIVGADVLLIYMRVAPCGVH